MPQVIRIKVGEVGTSRSLPASFPRRAGSLVLLVPNHSNRETRVRLNFWPVGLAGAIIHQDQLNWAVILLVNRINGFIDQVKTVAKGDNDRN